MVIGKKEKRKVQLMKDGRVKARLTELEGTMSQQWNDQGEETPPKAIFIPQQHSLPFEERCVSLENSVKIGRCVNRLLPTTTNAIFECRVISRHHATLWYENGKFLIVDNQSSNGTFINNHKSSITKEMGPQEVFSGDVIQFGIAVAENHEDDKVKNLFHPVVAKLKLYHPNGEEAKLTISADAPPLSLTDLYQLSHYVQEAIQREALLESKLNVLRERLESTRACACTAWKALVSENALIARLNALESTRKNIESHVNDKQAYQLAAQDSLQRAHEQRLEIEDQLEKSARESEALRHHNRSLTHSAEKANVELQKLVIAYERRLTAAQEAVASAERREGAMQQQLNKLQKAIQNQIPMVASDLVNAKDILYELLAKKYENEQKGAVEVMNKDSDEKQADLDMDSDNEKKIRLNHESKEEEEEKCMNEDGTGSPDDNANSYHNMSDDNLVTKSQQEFINSITLIATLNREITQLRERLELVEEDNVRLHALRDQILTQSIDNIELRIPSVVAEPPLSLLNVLQENLKEKKNLENEIEDLRQQLEQANYELTIRPSVDDYSELNETLQTLSRFTAPRDKVDVAVCTSDFEDHIKVENESIVKSEVKDFENEAVDIDNDLDEIEKMFREATESHEVDNDFSDEEEVDETVLRESLTPASSLGSTITLVPESFNDIDITTETNERNEQSDVKELKEPDEMDALELLDSVIAESSSDFEDTPMEETQIATSISDIIDNLDKENESIINDPCTSKSSEQFEWENSNDSLFSTKESTLSYKEETDIMERFENGSVCSLQEELVKAKEGWATAVAEKALLELELSRVRTDMRLKGHDNQMVVYVMPIAAALFYLVFYYYVS